MGSACLKSVISEPGWLPVDINWQRGRVTMARPESSLLTDTTFLVPPAFPGEKAELCELDFNECDATVLASRPSCYIFHSAFCCSTLLARTLHLDGKVRTLKEPQVTLLVAQYLRQHTNKPDELGKLRRLLVAGAVQGETTLIKPTNIANNLLLKGQALLQDNQILLLYGSLRGFLISVLKKGEQGRYMTRRMYALLAQDQTRFRDIPAQQLAGLTDLQIAAMVWLLQTELFESVIQADRQSIYRSLHCDDLLADPRTTIAAINQHLQLGLPVSDIDAICSSDAWSKDSKQQQSEFSADRRASQSNKIEAQYGADLDHICEWANGLAINGQVRHRLSRPVVADE